MMEYSGAVIIFTHLDQFMKLPPCVNRKEPFSQKPKPTPRSRTRAIPGSPITLALQKPATYSQFNIHVPGHPNDIATMT
jgi:hypothetical protein